ncbi:MAG: homoserine kinase, partial [Chloroflexi bacterium]|nr:homoserine kinase [Chloroflexota bacterium]
GFDCLGLALELYLGVTVALGGAGRVRATGEGAAEIPADETNLVCRALTACFQRAGEPLPGLDVNIENSIPVARGLGSSAAAVVAGLVAGNALLGDTLATGDLLALGVAIEGHPDNIAPSLLGGCTLVVPQGDGFLPVHVPLPPGIEAVVFVPEARLSTAAARRALPERVPLPDAVFNVGRAALLVLGLTSGRRDLLGPGTEDRLHQPYREALVPGMAALCDAARQAGAAGVFLSGAGPSILALAWNRPDQVAAAMAAAAETAAVPGRTIVTRPSVAGARVFTAEGTEIA